MVTKIEIRVTDNGPGIPENIKKKSSNPFSPPNPPDREPV
jgi:signal transduction histidine kinase